MLNRQEIIDKLREKAVDPIIIIPAMHLMERVLERIEKGYDLLPSPAPTAHEIREAIAAAIDQRVTNAQLVRISKETPNEARLLYGGLRGELFSNVLFPRIYKGIAMPFPRIPKLADYGGKLAEEIEEVFKKDVRGRMRRTYAKQHEVPLAATQAALESVTATLEAYLNLTVLNHPRVVHQRLKPLILLLPYAIPLARTMNSWTQWTVLVP